MWRAQGFATSSRLPDTRTESISPGEELRIPRPAKQEVALGNEADHAELVTAALTKERVDFVHPTDNVRADANPPIGGLVLA